MIILLCILLSLFIDPSHTVIRRFTQQDFDQWVDEDNFLIVLFCQANDDKICVKEKERLREVSDEMIAYQDLVFGYICKDSDSILLARYNVHKFPYVKLFPFGLEIKDYPLNIRNNDLKDFILQIRTNVFENRMMEDKKAKEIPKPIIIPEIDWLDFASTVKNPERHALLILYDENCVTLCELMDRVAKNFQNEPEVAFYKMNVDKSGSLRQRLPFERNPSIFWYPISDKDKGFVYAGDITYEILVEFINDRAGLSRDYNGELKHNAGRIMEIDQIIQENIIPILLKTNIDFVIFTVEKKGKELPHAKKFIDYYLAILKEIKKGDDPEKIFQRETKYIGEKMSKTNLVSSELENWRKFHNIVSAFVEYAALRLNEDMNKHRAELKEDFAYDDVAKFKYRDEL